MRKAAECIEEIKQFPVDKRVGIDDLVHYYRLAFIIDRCYAPSR
jgi:hypothetical protein